MRLSLKTMRKNWTLKSSLVDNAVPSSCKKWPQTSATCHLPPPAAGKQLRPKAPAHSYSGLVQHICIRLISRGGCQRDNLVVLNLMEVQLITARG